MPRFVKLWPAALSAVLVLCAFPPINLGLLVIVGLAPLLAALMKGGKKRALALGYTFGLIYMLAQMGWLETLVVRWTGSAPLAIFTWLLAGFLGAWYFALFGWLANRCFQRGWPWIIPILWAGVEVFRSYIPGLAFPWGLLADPLWPYPYLIQASFFGSIFLVSAWCALCALIVAMWLDGESWMRIRPYATICILLVTLSLGRFSLPLPNTKKTITIGQPGVDMAFGNPETQKADLSRACKTIVSSASETNSSLIVFPEGIGDGTTTPPTTPFPLTSGIPVIFGAQRGSGPYYQSVYSYDGQKWQFADKNRL